MAERVAQRPLWRGQTDTTRRRFWWVLGLSLLLHLPVTPLAGLFGLLALLGIREVPPEPLEELAGIPVTLLSEDELEQLGGKVEPAGAEEEAAAAPPEPVIEASPEPEPAVAKPPPKPPDPPDAGMRRRDPDPPDGGSPDAEAEKPEPDEAKDKPLAEKEPASEEGKGDPLALTGAASSVADPNANVKLILFNAPIRNHPLGPRIGRLVTRLPQWSSFFGPTPIDPVRDIDQLYVAGPQFRVSADVVAFIRYNIKDAAMRSALDSIVNREPKGKWLDTKIPAAQARADRAERVFILPRPGMLVMVPPRLTQDALEKAPQVVLPRGGSDAALVAFVATPWRAFLGLGLPLQVPESIQSATIKVLPAADGGVRIQIDAIDGTPEFAKRNAELLTRAINIATQRNMGALGALLFGGETLQLIEPVELRAKGNLISGTARVTPRQVDRILNFAESWLDAYNNRPTPRPSAAPVTPPVPAKPRAPTRLPTETPPG